MLFFFDFEDITTSGQSIFCCKAREGEGVAARVLESLASMLVLALKLHHQCSCLSIRLGRGKYTILLISLYLLVELKEPSIDWFSIR